MDIKIAISTDIFTCISQLPAGIQPKVNKFITRFQSDPTAPGINYEKINDARDKRMRSVRIDQDYRGIVLKPEQGNIYLLLWLDKHDQAYDWARRHKVDINAETGTLQVFPAEVVEDQGVAADEQVSGYSDIPGAFDELKEKELLRLGVPEELIPLVRTVSNELELDKIEHRLPEEAYEGLFLYLAGTRYDAIINEREKVEVVDTADLGAALRRLSSQSRFVVVEDELELQRMLNAPLAKWRVFLHPSQRKLATGHKSGAVRVLGGAGTGKTVVAMHRAKWLAENMDDDGKILFTTFTRNLAIDIEQNLKTICSPESMEKIEVVNLDYWVAQYLRKKNYDYQIQYRDTRDYWHTALDLAPVDLGLPDAFYREEWSRVIQPQSIETLDEYKRASRIGRGTRLSRSDRVKIWPVFAEYRNLLTRDGRREVEDAYRDAAALLSNHPGELRYSSVVVDEAQDMGTQAFRLIRQIIPEGPDDIFIVGDGHQRIYGRNKVVLSHCGINIRGRSRKLRINYRTTEEIRRWAVNLLEGYPVDDLDGGSDSNTGYKSLTHGEAPRLESFSNAEEQGRFVVELLRQRQQEGIRLGTICIAARTNKELDGVSEALQSADIPCYILDRKSSDQKEPDSVRLGTMHRVKGLEFDEMILVSLNKGMVPLEFVLRDKGDLVEQRHADLEERALLYVAITRAKKHAILLSYGEVSEYLAAGS